MRRTDFLGASKAITGAVAQTLNFNSSDLPSLNVVAFHFGMSGGNTFVDVNRIRVTANGQPIINMTRGQLQAYMDSLSNGRIPQPASSNSFTIPFAFLDRYDYDEADTCQFPIGAQVAIEVEMLATAVAGNMTIGWTKTSQAPQYFPKMLSQVMNIPASATSARYNLSEQGIIRALLIPLANVIRQRITLADQTIANLGGALFGGVATGDLILEAQRGLYGAGFFNTQPFQQLPTMLDAPSGSSFIELDTGPLWSGVATECVVYAVMPNGKAA